MCYFSNESFHLLIDDTLKMNAYFYISLKTQILVVYLT